MKATLYKDFSDASRVIEIPAGVPLYRGLEGVDLSGKRIAVNGEERTPDYVPGVNDVVVIRTIPYVSVATAIVIAVAVVSLVGAGIAGYYAYQARKQAAELEDAMKNASANGVKNLPYLRGASNSLATGNTQPYIIGEHLFTPYKLLQNYYHLSMGNPNDTAQYVLCVYQCGFGKQVIREVRADEAIIKTFDPNETVPQEGVFFFDSGSPFFTTESKLEIAQDGQPFSYVTPNNFNDVVVSETPSNAELRKSNDPDYQDLIFTLDRNARNVEICISIKGLCEFDSDGKKKSRTITVIPYFSLDGGGAWSELNKFLYFEDDHSFTRVIATEQRTKSITEFTWAQVSGLTEPILVKLVCTTPKATRTAYDQVYVQWVQSTLFHRDESEAAGALVNDRVLEPTEAALSTLIGMRIRATAANQDKLGKINILTAGVARTWTGTGWTTTRAPTRNLGAWLLEALTSSTHPASKLDDDEVDLESFGELYEHCAAEGLEVELVLVDGDEKGAVIDTLCDIGNCALYENAYGEVAVAIDAAKENAVDVLNTQNLLSLEVEKEFGRRTDGIRISYVSRERGYQPDSFLVMREGVTRGPTSLIRDLESPGRTTHEQNVKHARRLMAIEELRPRVVRTRGGREGVYYAPLSKVLVQHPALGNGLGSAEIKATVVVGGFITGLVLYEPIQYDSSVADGFGVIIRSTAEEYGDVLSATIAEEYTAATDGLVMEITLGTPIPEDNEVRPRPGDILSYGYLNGGAFDTVTSPMLIAEVAPEGKGYALSLVDYNEAIYDPGEIPTYTPNTTVRKTPLVEQVEVSTLIEDVNASVQRIKELFAKNTSATVPPTYDADADDPGAGWVAEEMIPGAGEYVWRLRSTWLGGVRSTVWTPNRVTGAQGLPGADGEDGSPGTDGADGINARGVSLTADALAITFDTAGNNPSPATINLTATPVNTSGTVYYEFFADDVSLGAASTTATKAYSLSGKTFATLPKKFEVQIREGAAGNPILARDQTSPSALRAGSSAIRELLPGAFASVPASSAGVVSSHAGTGSTLQVFEGNTALTFHTVAGAGRFLVGTPVVSPAGKITVGARSGSGTDTCTIADHSAMAADTDKVTITYPITGKRADGTDFTTSVVQVITKSKQGVENNGWTPNLTNVTKSDGGTFVKTGGTNGWGDAQVYASQGYTAAFCSAMALSLTAHAFFGLTSDPLADASYTSIDFAWFINGDVGTVNVRENGVQISAHGAFTTDTVLSIEYDGTNLRYLKDGVVVRTVAASGALCFDSSFYYVSRGLKNVLFGPMGPKGTTGADGKGVASSAVTYQVGTSGTTAPTGTWVSSPPATSVGQFLWTRTIITYTDATTTTTYSVAAHGSTGPQGESSLGIGVKKGYSAFSTANDGECYIHGFTTAGAAADVDGYIYFDSVKLPVTKGLAWNPNGTGLDGYILLPIAGGAPVAGYFRISNQTWYSYNGDTITALVEADWLAIGEAVNTANEVTESVSLYPRAKRLSEIRLGLKAACLGIAASVTTGSGTVSLHQVSAAPYAFSASGISFRARPGDCVFVRGGTATTGIGDSVKDIQVFNGREWEAPRTEDQHRYRWLAYYPIGDAMRVYQANGVAAPAIFDAVFNVIFSDDILATRIAAKIATIAAIFAEDIVATGSITGATLKALGGRIKMSRDIAGTYDGIMASEGDVDSPANGEAAIGLLPGLYPEIAFMQRVAGAWVKRHRIIEGQFPFGNSLLFLDNNQDTAVVIEDDGSLRAMRGLTSDEGFRAGKGVSLNYINTSAVNYDQLFGLLEATGAFLSTGPLYSRLGILYSPADSMSYPVAIWKLSSTQYRIQQSSEFIYYIDDGSSTIFGNYLGIL